MKVTITLNNPKDGEVNINELDNIHDASVESLQCHILDELSFEIRMTTLKKLLSKLRHGGEILVSGTDIVVVANNVVMRKITYDQDINHVIYSNLSTSTVENMCDLLEGNGLIITDKSIDIESGYYDVKAKRPVS